MQYLRTITLLLFLTACSAGATQTAAQSQPTQTSAAAVAIAAQRPTATVTSLPPTASAALSQVPTLAATPASAASATSQVTTVPPSATPDPYAEYNQYTIEGLRARTYGEGEIQIVRRLSQTPQFTRELFAYQSDGLRITGQLTRPKGAGPFPVIVLAHGYSPLATYTPGYDTQTASDYLAARGYLCLAPDFRSHAGSDKAPNTFRAGHVIDTLNLLPLIAKLPYAKPGKIGMWGHSNGGEITSKVMLISDQIGSALIYAPASPYLPDNFYAFHARDRFGNPSNTADFPLKPDQAPDLFNRMSPINYLQYTQVPVQIHYGTADASVPRAWVDKLYNGLQAAGKQSELFIYNRGTHSLQGAQKQQYLQRTAAFFDQYIK